MYALLDFRLILHNCPELNDQQLQHADDDAQGQCEAKDAHEQAEDASLIEGSSAGVNVLVQKPDSAATEHHSCVQIAHHVEE